jgi:tetratricopeptide (TPR) repeat protein
VGVAAVWIVWTGMPWYTTILVAFVVWAIAQTASLGAGAIAARYAGLRGGTTPPRREYSAAQALAAQGHYRAAVDAYELAAAESDGDPEPYLAVARILRDHLRDFEASAAWFRRARRDARLGRGQELLVAQELVELYTNKLDDPRRAIPELARIVRLRPDTPHGQAAARRLAELRSEVERE